MTAPAILPLLRCPDCRGAFAIGDGDLRCEGCGRCVVATGGYLDLRPREAFAEQTKYLDEALHADDRHATVSPPLLGAGVRQWMLGRFLRPRAGDLVVDLGCGPGQALVWNSAAGATIVGVDVSPYFAAEALARGTLVRGDLRRLPFADGAFTKGYALDVFEHLSRAALEAVLLEIARVVRPGGQVFVYSHVRKNARLAAGVRAVNALSHLLQRAGLVDLRQEHLRKADHLNPLADVPELEAVVDAAGFRIARIRYYTPILGALIQNVLMRMAERALGWWSGRRSRAPDATAAERRTLEARAARAAAKTRLEARGPLYVLVQTLTLLMRVDVLLFGRVRSGPFFALLERQPARAARDDAAR